MEWLRNNWDYKGLVQSDMELNIGDIINQWVILEKIDSSTYLCECSCGKKSKVRKFDLLNNKSTSCGHDNKIYNIKEGQQFNDWEAIRSVGDYKWLFRCSCGIEKELPINLVASGRSKSCGHNTTSFKDLTNQQFGHLKAIRYTKGLGWLCECDCGNTKYIKGYALINKKVTSCGHTKFRKKDSEKFIGKRFGRLQVLGYAGNYKWYCICDCGTKTTVLEANLLNNTVKSCGCLRQEIIDSSISKDKLLETINLYTESTNEKPFACDIAEILGRSTKYIYLG